VLVTLAAAAAFLRLPDRDLYQVRKPWAWALNVVQAAGIGLLLRAVSVTGFDRMIGLPQLLAYGRGEHPAPEYEAQGPPPQALNHPERLGPFGWVSHPDNLPIILVVWAFPKMTVNRLTLALWATVYALAWISTDKHSANAALAQDGHGTAEFGDERYLKGCADRSIARSLFADGDRPDFSSACIAGYGNPLFMGFSGDRRVWDGVGA
jgi:hypothetical protein